MPTEAKLIDISLMTDASAWLRLLREVRETNESRILREHGQELARLVPVKPRRRRVDHKPVTVDDSPSLLAGSATDAPRADASEQSQGEASGASSPADPRQTPFVNDRNEPPCSTARALREFVGTWVGNDLPERIAEVYASRGEMRP